MFKKIALCAMLVFILAPASVMAAGQQGQASDIGKEAGCSLHVQHQVAGATVAQEKSQNSQRQGSGIASQNGDIQMLQTRIQDQTGEQDQVTVRNMTRDQVQQGSDSGLAGESRGTGSNGGNCAGDGRNLQKQDGSTDMVQNRSGITTGNGQNILAGFTEQLGVQFRNMGGIFQTLGQ